MKYYYYEIRPSTVNHYSWNMSMNCELLHMKYIDGLWSNTKYCLSWNTSLKYEECLSWNIASHEISLWTEVIFNQDLIIHADFFYVNSAVWMQTSSFILTCSQSTFVLTLVLSAFLYFFDIKSLLVLVRCLLL